MMKAVEIRAILDRLLVEPVLVESAELAKGVTAFRRAMAEERGAGTYYEYAMCLEAGIALADEDLSAWALAGALITMRTMQAGELTADRLEQLAVLPGGKRTPWLGEILQGLRNPIR